MNSKTGYKETLNLPNTEFAMKANLPQREPEILAEWERIGLYQKLRELGKDRPRFILHDGPPYANGSVHLGTALNKVLKDIVIKSKTLSGYDAPFVPGWDCHGLPIELQVEKAKGKAGVKVDSREFRKICREYAASQIVLQKQDFIRLGVMGDWNQPYLTMNYSYEANAIRALSKIINKGYLFQGKKPVLWCTECGSALAEAEVEYKEKASPAIDVSFETTDFKKWLDIFKVESSATKVLVPIWTTTPWTLPANQAVAMHPELLYVLVECTWNNELVCLVLAENLLAQAMHRYGIHQYKVLGEVKGEALEHLELQHPFLPRAVPVILGMHVTADTGTGSVHTAPAHGQEDYVVGLKYGLKIENPVNAQSRFFEDTFLVGGLQVFKANEVLITELADRGHLLHSVTIQHSYPHCWRHKTPLIFRATSQWFIGMEQNHLRQQSLDAVHSVKWIPSWGELRIGKMIESRPDWCVSRQRTWGIPLSIFCHKKTGELHPKTVEIMEKVATLVEKDGVDVWYDLDPATYLNASDVDEYEKVTDILDVWFDSGVTHFCVLDARPELSVPADLYLEGSDQHRGWFQTSLLTSMAIRGKAPYKTVLTHGYVVDGHGHKMSKSIGNVVVAKDVMNQLGADVLRLWASSADYTGDVSFSDEILKRSAEAYRRIRNTARFLLSNLYDFDPTVDLVADDQLLALDRWMIRTTKDLQSKIIKAYQEYHFQWIFQLIHNFCTVEMGSFYLDIIKDRQYTTQKKGLARRSGQTAMYHTIEALVRWIAPILSFTAEEIWRYLPGSRSESVFLNTWYEDFPAVVEQQDSMDWHWIIHVRDEVNKILENHRNQGEIGSALDASVILYAEGGSYKKLAELGEELRFVLITSNAKVLPASEMTGETKLIEPGLWVKIIASTDAKCGRCWQRRKDVGEDPSHLDLCGRCVTNVAGTGEVRKFA